MRPASGSSGSAAPPPPGAASVPLLSTPQPPAPGAARPPPPGGGGGLPPAGVRPVAEYAHYTNQQYTLHACRVVEKTSSKGKAQPRVLILNERVLSLAATTTQRVHRLVRLEDIVGARVQRDAGGDAPLVHLQMDKGTGEPDIVYRQTLQAEQPPAAGDGSDVVRILSELRRRGPTGEGIDVEELRGGSLVGELQQNGRLKKTKNYFTPKQKVREGKLRPSSQSPTPSARGEDKEAAEAESPGSGAAAEAPPPPVVPPAGSPPPGADRGADEPRTPLAAPAAGGWGAAAPAAPPGAARYVVRLSRPDEPIGMQVREVGGEVAITACDAGSAAAAARVPSGALRAVNGEAVRTASDVALAVRRAAATGAWAAISLDISAYGTPPPSAGGGRGAGAAARSRALVVGASYDGGQHELRSAPAAARAVYRALELRGAVSPAASRVLLEDPAAPPDMQPTRGNIKLALSWLVTDPPPGATLYFIFVGHGMNMRPGAEEARRRDGEGEAVYPMDFHSAGVLQQQDLLRALSRAPSGCRVVMLCDCCGAGTMLDLPHKLKSRTADGALSAIAPPPGAVPPPLSAHAMLLSCCRDEDATAPDAAGSGVLARAAAAAIARPGAEPPVAALLEEMRRGLAAHVGRGAQLAMVSSTAPVDAAAQPFGFVPPHAAASSPPPGPARCGRPPPPASCGRTVSARSGYTNGGASPHHPQHSMASLDATQAGCVAGRGAASPPPGGARRRPLAMTQTQPLHATPQGAPMSAPGPGGTHSAGCSFVSQQPITLRSLESRLATTAPRTPGSRGSSPSGVAGSPFTGSPGGRGRGQRSPLPLQPPLAGVTPLAPAVRV